MLCSKTMKHSVWRPSEPNVGEILAATYAFEEADTTSWLDGIARAVAPSVAGGSLLVAALVRVTGDDGVEFLASTPRETWDEGNARAAGAPGFARLVLSQPQVYLGAQILRAGNLGAYPRFLEQGLIAKIPKDVFHVFGAAGDGVGIALSVALDDEAPPLSTKAISTWSRISAHLAAAARLRVAGKKEPEVVLSESGAVLHAQGLAERADVRAQVRSAARSVDRVRGRRVTDPEEALALWHVLTSGRYTIADQFDQAGRRYVVAYENLPVAGAQLPGLSNRERQVVCFAALGHRTKHIAYELGVATSTVATHLSAAMRKLGVRNRTELIRMVHERGFA